MRNLFIASAVVILFLTAVAKLVSGWGAAPVLEVRDPLLLLRNRSVLVFVAALELVVVVALVRGGSPLTKLWLIAWLSSNFVIYRFGLWLTAAGRPCPCLGTVTAQLGVPQHLVDAALKAIVIYLFLGSTILLVLARQRAPVRGPSATPDGPTPEGLGAT